jgi:hypothetical protein
LSLTLLLTEEVRQISQPYLEKRREREEENVREERERYRWRDK